MPRPIITEELVFSTADTMTTEGTDPSIVTVQGRIGGGSFTTVKRFLDQWRAARAAGAVATLDIPPEVDAKGKEFVLATWSLAKHVANKEALAAKEAAAVEVSAVRAEIVQALEEVARLEGNEAQLRETVSSQESKIREMEITLAAAQAQARRTTELEKTLDLVRADLKVAEKAATSNAVEAGRSTGEMAALRQQVQDLMGALKSVRKNK
jgi:hypothetical protein